MDFQAELQALFSLQGLITLVILSSLELILGVDNIIFISLILTKIPGEKRFKTRVTALSLAFVMRIFMLFCLVWLTGITSTLFTISNFHVSISDILYLIGGTYLTITSLKELIKHLKKKDDVEVFSTKIYDSIILQIVLVDMLFSFDTVFTAIGVTPNFLLMVLAIAIGMVFMVYISGKLSGFLEKHPIVKTLALCFLILIGLLLITKGVELELPSVYLYAGLLIAIIATGITVLFEKK